MSGEQLWYNRPLPGARVNMAHPLSLGLVGCWLLNENDGIRAMDSGPYGNHGLLTGFAGSIPGRFNGLNFDGTDDYINCGSGGSLDFTGALTIESWVIPSSANRAIIKKRNAGNTTGWVLGIGTGPKIGFWIYTTGWTGSWTFSANTLTENVFSHVVGTWDGTTMKSYINGIADANTTALSGSIASGTDRTTIGAEWDGIETYASYYNRSISLVRVYNRALNADEIKVLYISPYSPMGLRMFF